MIEPRVVRCGVREVMYQVPRRALGAGGSRHATRCDAMRWPERGRSGTARLCAGNKEVDLERIEMLIERREEEKRKEKN